MSRTARVDDEVYTHLLARKAGIELATGRPASFSDAVRAVLTEDRDHHRAVLECWQRDRLIGRLRDLGLMVVGGKPSLVERLLDAGEPLDS